MTCPSNTRLQRIVLDQRAQFVFVEKYCKYTVNSKQRADLVRHKNNKVQGKVALSDVTFRATR